MPENFTINTTRHEIESSAFRQMAAFIHEHYDDIQGNNMTGEEGWLLGVVNFTEALLKKLEVN